MSRRSDFSLLRAVVARPAAAAPAASRITALRRSPANGVIVCHSSPAIATDSTACFGNNNGFVFAVSTTSAGTTVSSSPKFRDDWGSSCNSAAFSTTGKAPSRAEGAATLATSNPGNCTALLDGGPSLGAGNGIVEVFKQ